MSLFPRVEDDGNILVNLNIQRSRLAPKPARGEGAMGEDPQRTITVSTKSTVRVAPKHSVLMSGAKNVTNEETTELLIIVSAHVVDGPKPAR